MDDLGITHIELEQYRAVASQAMSREFAEAADLEVARNQFMDALVFRLTQTIWGRKVGERLVRWPADWWQAVKERWFPGWALRRWPVEYAWATIEARDLFPAVVVPPGARRTLVYQASYPQDRGSGSV